MRPLGPGARHAPVDAWYPCPSAYQKCTCLSHHRLVLYSVTYSSPSQFGVLLASYQGQPNSAMACMLSGLWYHACWRAACTAPRASSLIGPRLVSAFDTSMHTGACACSCGTLPRHNTTTTHALHPCKAYTPRHGTHCCTPCTSSLQQLVCTVLGGPMATSEPKASCAPRWIPTKCLLPFQMSRAGSEGRRLPGQGVGSSGSATCATRPRQARGMECKATQSALPCHTRGVLYTLLLQHLEVLSHIFCVCLPPAKCMLAALTAI